MTGGGRALPCAGWAPGGAGPRPLVRTLFFTLALTITQVKQHPWVSHELSLRRVTETGNYTIITVNEADLRQAVISGHIDHFRSNRHAYPRHHNNPHPHPHDHSHHNPFRRERGSIFKTTNRVEARMYKAFSGTELGR